MLSKVLSSTVVGMDAHLIEVEVDVGGGLPQFSVVGLPDVIVKESRDRVRAALKNSGFSFPIKRITVNLAPAGLKKEGSGLDLAIGDEVEQSHACAMGERLEALFESFGGPFRFRHRPPRHIRLDRYDNRTYPHITFVNANMRR